ncbi:hypothetical protein LINGRAHAP2_LOCUS36320 [Linum grandiflorum]
MTTNMRVWFSSYRSSFVATGK